MWECNTWLSSVIISDKKASAHLPHPFIIEAESSNYSPDSRNAYLHLHRLENAEFVKMREVKNDEELMGRGSGKKGKG